MGDRRFMVASRHQVLSNTYLSL